MNSTNRSLAKAGKIALRAALLTAFLVASVAPVRAQAPPLSANLWYAGTRLVFDHPQIRSGELAVASDDAGLARFLSKLNATLAYQPGQNYVVVTGGDRRTVAFTLGDTRYRAAGVGLSAPFAPYAAGGVVYLPFLELARALYVDPVDDAGTTVLQPQIAALDVRASGRTSVVTLRGASPLHFKRLSAPADDRVTLAFSGIASTLVADRHIGAAALKDISIEVTGTARNPTTNVTFEAAPGSLRALGTSDSPNTVVIGFAPPGISLGGSAIPPQGDAATAVASLTLANSSDSPSAAAPPAPPVPGPGLPAATPTPTALGLTPATITAIDVQPLDQSLNVKALVAGPVTYEWHRLSDNRWYVDFKPATLAIAPQDQALENGAVVSLRVKPFVGPNDHLPTVRIALTLATPRIVSILPADGGVTLAVDKLDDLEPQKMGFGELQNGKLVGSVVPLPPAPAAAAPEFSPAPAWKFGSPAGTSAHLIVIDPGHGGSDAGSIHNGLVEKDLNLDISKRLRSILVARGWQVKMTRDSDVDVYAPNDSAHDELQARCDVANNAGARLFISVHSNGFETSGPRGTTTYYYKPDSYDLAQDVHAHFSADLPTKDDGLHKGNYYVIRHATMPAILVETAFLSNPGDASLLKSPAFLQKIALSIADGVGDYAQSTPLGSTSGASDGN